MATATGNRRPILNAGLWLAQLLLAFMYGAFGFMKATGNLADLSAMMKWIPDFPPLFVRGLGVAEILGAVGLILPALTRIAPRWTPITACVILVHQACAVALHLSKGEASVLGLNVVIIALAAFVAWGRGKAVPVAPRS